MPDAGDRRYVVTAGQLRTALVVGAAGMVGLLVLLLLLTTSRPQGSFVRVDDSQHRQLLEAAQAKLVGFELRDGGGARIDIDHAIQLVAERGVDLPLVAGGVAPEPPAADAAIDGAAIYASTCSACHQANGGGLPGAFPPLAGHVGDLYVADRAMVPLTILFGIMGPIEVQGVTYSSLMPPMGNMGDAELAALVNHVMTAWGDADALGDAFEPYEAEEIAAWRELGLAMPQVHARRTALTLP
jgi:mono/diheme cytochrome c family protein